MSACLTCSTAGQLRYTHLQHKGITPRQFETNHIIHMYRLNDETNIMSCLFIAVNDEIFYVVEVNNEIMR